MTVRGRPCHVYDIVCLYKQHGLFDSVRFRVDTRSRVPKGTAARNASSFWYQASSSPIRAALWESAWLPVYRSFRLRGKHSTVGYVLQFAIR